MFNVNDVFEDINEEKIFRILYYENNNVIYAIDVESDVLPVEIQYDELLKKIQENG